MLWIRAIGVLALLFVVVAVYMETMAKGFTAVQPAQENGPCNFKAGELPQGLKGRVLAMEMVRSRCDVEAIVGDVSHANRGVMRGSLKVDTYGFIPVYWLLYVLLGLVLIRRGSHWAMWVGAAAIVCGTGAALFDLAENHRILNLLNLPLSVTTDEMAHAVRKVSLLKWALAFITIGLLSSILFSLNRSPHWLLATPGPIAGVLLIAAAILGLFGLRSNYLLEWAPIPAALGLLYLGFVAGACPQVLLD